MLKALLARSVQHIIWLTLHEVIKQYVDSNHAIHAAAAEWRPG